MHSNISCIFCHEDAELITSERVIQKGLIKVKVPQHSYKCNTCERTFRTREQILEDGDLKKLPVTPIQNRGHNFTTPIHGDTPKNND